MTTFHSRIKQKHNRIGPRERIILGAVFILLAYFSWLGGCAFTSAELTLGWVGLGVLILIVFLPYDHVEGSSGSEPRPGRPAIAVLGDPVFAFGGLFIFLLFIQWLNSGRSLVLDPMKMAWVYGAPPVSWLPSSINGPDASRMLHWFVPAWTCILAVRNRLLSGESRNLLARLVTMIAAALALFGIVQMLLRVQLVYGLQDGSAHSHFFASFGYSNHAGAYFTLVFALASALLLDDLFDSHSRRWTVWRVLLAVAAVLCLGAASLSMSQAGIINSWGIACVVSTAVVVLSWKHWGPVARFNVVVAIVAFACLAFFLVSGLGQTRASREYETFGKGNVAEKVEGRQYMPRAAFRMWRDAPWFGVGGWGYRYLLPEYIEEERLARLGPGAANAHCDPLQFLAEFGAIGSGLLLGCVLTMVAPIVRSGSWRRPGVYIALVGLAATWVHSLVDLPFRNPAILCTWVVILAILSRSTARKGPRLQGLKDEG